MLFLFRKDSVPVSPMLGSLGQSRTQSTSSRNLKRMFVGAFLPPGARYCHLEIRCEELSLSAAMKRVDFGSKFNKVKKTRMIAPSLTMKKTERLSLRESEFESIISSECRIIIIIRIESVDGNNHNLKEDEDWIVS